MRAVVGWHPLLPRMPLSLQYLTSRDSYKAAAGVARALGRAARLEDLQQQQQQVPGESRSCRLAVSAAVVLAAVQLQLLECE